MLVGSYHRRDGGEHPSCEFQTDRVYRPACPYLGKSDIILRDRSQLIKEESLSSVCWNVHSRIDDIRRWGTAEQPHPYGERLIRGVCHRQCKPSAAAVISKEICELFSGSQVGPSPRVRGKHRARLGAGR